jgi:hypothetical protein
MLAKKTVKNQITLPKAIVEKLLNTVSLQGEEIVLKPVVIEAKGHKTGTVRSRMKALGLTEKDVDAASIIQRNGTGVPPVLHVCNSTTSPSASG